MSKFYYTLRTKSSIVLQITIWMGTLLSKQTDRSDQNAHSSHYPFTQDASLRRSGRCARLAGGLIQSFC